MRDPRKTWHRRLFAPARRLAVCALAAVCWCAPASAVEVDWLYDVEVPVQDQSTQARLDGASRALAELLTRLTGLASVPRNEQVSRALAAPDLYYNQFRFEQAEPDEETGDEGGLRLRLQFVPHAVLNLVRDAGLPIWSANRPVVMAWIAVDDGTERRILAADSDNPLVSAIQERARDRGVPLQLPLMDLADQFAVDPAAVWGRLPEVLESASRRYGADTLLLGRLYREPDDRWAASWELWVDGEVNQLEQAAGDVAPLGRAAADLAADELAARYAVLDRGVRRLDLSVSRVVSAADYAGLLRYVNGLEFVERVVISGASGDRIDVSLITAAQPSQLLELLRLDGRLLPDRAGEMPGAPIELVWQAP